VTTLSIVSLFVFLATFSTIELCSSNRFFSFTITFSSEFKLSFFSLPEGIIFKLLLLLLSIFDDFERI
jgi:hypothetical protein